MRSLKWLAGCLIWACTSYLPAQDWKPLALQAKVTHVQPMTGIVLWTSNELVDKTPIQLEFAYMRYDQVVRGPQQYDWQALDNLLQEVADRKHQLILRWYDTYVGQPNGLPEYLQKLPGYRAVTAKSEGKPTGFPDWSQPSVQQFALDFFEQFAARYDRDPRLAFVQVGFGLWSEYHIYDGPFRLGSTFPSQAYQATFARHLSKVLQQSAWMISVDAADNERAPYTDDQQLLALPFGLFDDSFNHARHAQENEPNWRALGWDRWQRAPVGGEFAFFEKADQKLALAPRGPHGIPFEKQAAKFHVSFMIGDDQVNYQNAERIQQASLACGYRFRVLSLETNGQQTRAKLTNAGVAPIYYDAYPAMRGTRAQESLKHLLPGQTKEFTIPSDGRGSDFSISCDRLTPGQHIQFEADLPAR